MHVIVAGASPAVITIGIDPAIEIGPVTLAWHGLTIAIGILVGGWVGAREARRRGLDPERLYTIGLILIVAALIGSRIFYLAEHGPASDYFLAVRNTHPEADVPSPEVAYHSGGLYEVLIGAIVFAVVWSLRHRVR